jgi:ribonuclease T2
MDATGGFIPHVGCSAEGYLNEVWYYFHLRGRVGDNHANEFQFVGTNSTFRSTCPTAGIKYPPKMKHDERKDVTWASMDDQLHLEDL